MTRRLLLPLVFLLVAGAAGAQSPRSDFTRVADSVAGQGTSFDRTARLVRWINTSFTWSYTDYQKRTPAEVVARREGNCAELALVLHTLLDSLGIRSRWIREVNVQPAPTPRRQATAEQLVASRGKQFSVFGLQHNDHVWLEVWDDARAGWFPADPAYGVVGYDEWLPARLAFSARPKPAVPAVVDVAADMLVPFAVLAQPNRGPMFEEDRTDEYLVRRFDALYGGKASSLPSWGTWVRAVHELAPHARAAFEGTEDLHAETQAIARLKATYDRLVAEAAERGLGWAVGG